MGVFVGRWKSQGTTGDGAPVPGTPMFGEETFEWLPEGFFLVHRFDRRIGKGSHKGIAVMGYDSSKQHYFAQFFDSLGYARTYDVGLDNQLWTFTGTWERATFAFNDRRDAYDVDWDVTTDGTTWRHLCHLKAVKQEDTTIAAAVERISQSLETERRG
jgi:Protein of unknown function (DUF1579)